MNDDLIQKLKGYKELLDSGILSQEEFDELKTKALADFGNEKTASSNTIATEEDSPAVSQPQTVVNPEIVGGQSNYVLPEVNFQHVPLEGEVKAKIAQYKSMLGFSTDTTNVLFGEQPIHDADDLKNVTMALSITGNNIVSFEPEGILIIGLSASVQFNGKNMFVPYGDIEALTYYRAMLGYDHFTFVAKGEIFDFAFKVQLDTVLRMTLKLPGVFGIIKQDQFLQSIADKYPDIAQ